MSKQIIRVTGQPRADGIDIDRLALALLQFAVRHPERQGTHTARRGLKLTTHSERTTNPHQSEGAA